MINNCHNKYHIKIKMKPFEVKWMIYIDFHKENKKKILNLKLVIMQEHQNVFVKGYVPNWSEKGFTIKKVKIIVPCTYIISDLIRKLLEDFVKKNLKKSNRV